MLHLLLLACLVTTAAAADPLAGLRFLDGRDHALSDWPGQPVLVVYYCSHCPTARKHMATDVQEVGRLIESEHLAAQLICVTPEFDGDALRSYAKTVCPDIAATALFANDPANSESISLNNIYQIRLFHDGAVSQLGPDNLAASIGPTLRAAKAFRYPVADLPESAIPAWWLVERGRPGALSSAIKARSKEPAKTIVAAAEAALTRRQGELVAAPESLATVEGLERLLVDGEGLPSLKPASERLKELLKAPGLKDELKARDLFFACKHQLDSKNPKEQQAAKANLAKLAALFPATTYGQRAATIH
jgi:hypothetical protein